MGQFHSDFSHDQLRYAGESAEAVSEKCIILGKKCYLDVVTLIDKNTLQRIDHVMINGEKTPVRGQYHIRMKGIPEESIKLYSKLKNKSIVEIY